MNEFDDDLYELTTEEGKLNMKGLVSALLALVLAAVVLITGAHAVMLVLSQTGSYTFTGQDSMITTFLTAIRVAFPLVTEAAAVVAAIGFVLALWRGAQKTVGLAIEAIWLMFAALNMITFFAVERGAALQGWQVMWVQYGLPLSALIAGSLVYALKRVDPTQKRQQERSATSERVDAMRFRFFQKARLSPAMLNIEKQRAFMGVVDGLRREGYNNQQIRFMIQHTPELMSDGDENGQPDVLELDRPVRAAPAPKPGLFDRMFGRPAQPAPVVEAQPPTADIDALAAAVLSRLSLAQPVSDSTHSATTQSPTQSPTQSGQGNGPAAHKLGVDARNPTSRQ